MTLRGAQLRIARPSRDLDATIRFYRDGLGLAVLSSFQGHEGFDGVMLGHQGDGYHLEFTRAADRRASKAPDEEDLLVFYLPEKSAWERAVARLAALGHEPVRSSNPYWDRQGRTFQDPDGHRVVLQRARWGASGLIGK